MNELTELEKQEIKRKAHEYYLQNKDKIKAYTKKWQQENKDKIKQYYETRKKKMQEYQRQYQKDHPEEHSKRELKYQKKTRARANFLVKIYREMKIAVNVYEAKGEENLTEGDRAVRDEYLKLIDIIEHSEELGVKL